MDNGNMQPGSTKDYSRPILKTYSCASTWWRIIFVSGGRKAYLTTRAGKLKQRRITKIVILQLNVEHTNWSRATILSNTLDSFSKLPVYTSNIILCVKMSDFCKFPMVLVSGYTYRKTSSISRTKSQNLNVSCILLQLSSLNPLKPGVKLRMKM